MTLPIGAARGLRNRETTGRFRACGVLEFAAEDALLTNGDVIVRAVSESNTIPGVPVVVYLESYPDGMIFFQGYCFSQQPVGSGERHRN